LENGNPIIKCDNLVKIYKTEETEVMALQGLDMEIQEKELMAIVGSSGSGKTTFLNMLGALDRPTAGKLFVDGKDLYKLSPKEVVEYKRKTVGFVWQNSGRNLLPYLTASQNVQMPIMFEESKDRKAWAEELLEIVGLSQKRNSYPQLMSGGEQQRVAIAVALVNRPKILLADEPTGAVDVKTADHIFDVFRRLNKEYGTTVVIVTHDMKQTDKVGRVVFIRDGKISSERLNKNIDAIFLNKVAGFTEHRDEFFILDRAGRVQLTKEMLNTAGVMGSRVRVKTEEGKITILPE
jgi:ABC-type lipoprotein export system ATPase subunit